MTYPLETASSNNPYRASMAAQRMSAAPQRSSFIPERKSYMDAFSADAADQSLDDHSQFVADGAPRYKPYRASEAPSRTSVAPSHRMSIIPERTSRSDVPSLDMSEQSWDDPSPSTPSRGTSEDAYTDREAADGDIPKKDVWSMTEPPQYSSKRVLRKIKRLVKKRGKEIEILTVFTSDDNIVCSHEAPGAAQEQHRYIPNPDEGKYLRLALELGFKQEGCPFQFGGVTWLSGKQEEVEEKRTLLGSTANGKLKSKFSIQDPQAGNHQFYAVLSPTGRYVFAAILKETPSGTVSPKAMRKIRNLADKMEVYEAWAGSGGFMAKIASKLP